MRARFAKSIKQPVLNSVYLSSFTQETLELLKSYRPFTSYHKDLKEYEVTPEVYAKLSEPTTQVVDERVRYPKFERKHKDEEYGYQEDAVEFAMKSDNVFLNFSQGMGKSFTTMRILLKRGIERALIICGQGNLQEEWVKDAKKHRLQEALSMNIVGGDTGAGNQKKVKWLELADDGVDLINIEALRNEAIVKALNDRQYQCIVVDEVQSAKGWKAQQTEGLHELIRYEGQMRIALSGTPVLNNPLEFFSMLMYFGMLQDTARTTFEKYYGEWGFDFWGHFVCKGYKNTKDLVDLMLPVVCYAGKEELNLPEKRRKKIDIDWDMPERFCYLRQMYKASAKRMKAAGFTSKAQIRAEMIQLSSSAAEKIQFVEDHAKQSKVLVFSNYTTVLERYRETLANKGVKVLYYHGGLSMTERMNILEQWHTGEYDVLLLSIMTARYGLNLTEATETIFVEPPSSLAILEQAEDRAHRIGQGLPVTSYLLAGSEIDEDGLNNIETKQRDLDTLMEEMKRQIAG